MAIASNWYEFDTDNTALQLLLKRIKSIIHLSVGKNYLVADLNFLALFIM